MVDYQTIDYFKPPKSDYPTYINQGGFPLSLCNAPHGPVSPDQILTCDNIDLKAYLYLPKNGVGVGPGLVRPVPPPFALLGTIRTTQHDLPLIVYVEGSFANSDNPNLPNPSLYPNSCNQGRYFSQQGYAYLAIVRRGYNPSTGENEIVRQQTHPDTLEYLANHSFEVHEAITHMRNLKNITGDPLIDPAKVALMGHSLGGLVTLFYAQAGNSQPLEDACQCSDPQFIAKAKALIAPASQSWDGFDRVDGFLDDTSVRLEQLKTAAANSLLPAYYFEPLNDASSRPAVVLAKAAGDANLAANQFCRELVYLNASPSDDSTTLARRIVDTCPLSGLEVQSALFPTIDLTPFPTADSAHVPFVTLPDQIAKWGPSVLDFFTRYGVVP
jgi:pimeloyl-ACP methyl ester carboxylesterase